jgi:hypothetical protein
MYRALRRHTVEPMVVLRARRQTKNARARHQVAGRERWGSLPGPIRPRRLPDIISHFSPYKHADGTANPTPNTARNSGTDARACRL